MLHVGDGDVVASPVKKIPKLPHMGSQFQTVANYDVGCILFN